MDPIVTVDVLSHSLGQYPCRWQENVLRKGHHFLIHAKLSYWIVVRSVQGLVKPQLCIKCKPV